MHGFVWNVDYIGTYMKRGCEGHIENRVSSPRWTRGAMQDRIVTATVCSYAGGFVRGYFGL